MESEPQCICDLYAWERCPACRDEACRKKGIIVSSLEWRAALGDPDARETLGMEPWAFLDA
jgi:hypothetical protein